MLLALTMVGCKYQITQEEKDQIVKEALTEEKKNEIFTEVLLATDSDALLNVLDDDVKAGLFDSFIADSRTAETFLSLLLEEEKTVIYEELLTDDEKSKIYNERLTEEEKKRIYNSLLTETEKNKIYLEKLTEAEKNKIYAEKLTESEKVRIFNEVFKWNEGTLLELLSDEQLEAVLSSLSDAQVEELAEIRREKIAPDEVTGLVVYAMDSSARVVWTDCASEDVFGYEVTYAEKEPGNARSIAAMQQGSLFVASSAKSDKSNEVFLGNLENGKDYIFTVRSMDVNGNKSQGRIFQTVLLDTALPVLHVKYKGVITKNVKLDSSMTVYNCDYRNNNLSDVQMTIKGRGNSSWNMPKKSYTIKFNEKTDFLGMKKHKTFALIANYCDKTLLRNATAYGMGRQIFTNMAWNPDTRNVHLYMNGQYMGIYMVCETAKIDKNRVNIPNVEDFDWNNAKGDVIENYGFLLEVNSRKDENFNFAGEKFWFSLKDPDGEDIDEEKKEYIVNVINKAETALYSDDFDNPESENYWENYFDKESIIDWWLVNEIAKNNDSIFFSSVYVYYNPKKGKIFMGPLWDFDIGFGNVNYNGCDKPEGFWVKNSGWLGRMFSDSDFTETAKNRWVYTKPQVEEYLDQNFNDEAKLLSKECQKNFEKWNILGKYTWPNAAGYEERITYDSEVQYMKDWLLERIEWMDEQISTW